jgi:hypothetical protein
LSASLLRSCLLPLPACLPACLPAVADPFLLQREDKLYMFYETKSAEQQKGQIGVAASEDGGRSFRHLAVVLDLPWHLSYPFVFEHEGQVGTAPHQPGQVQQQGQGQRQQQDLSRSWFAGAPICLHCSCSALLPTPTATS